MIKTKEQSEQQIADIYREYDLIYASLYQHLLKTLEIDHLTDEARKLED